MLRSPADGSGFQLLYGWGRTAPSGAHVFAPRTIEQVEALLHDVHGRGLVARGLGRSWGDAAQNAGGTVIDMTGVQEVSVDPKRGIVRAHAGTSLASLMDAALPHGLTLPIMPGTCRITVGGAIAADIHGKDHHVAGSVRDHIADLRMWVPQEGEVTVRPGSDLFDATLGGMGLTGLILEATIALRRVESAYVAMDTERTADIDDAVERMAAGDDAYRYSVAWLDCLAPSRRIGRAVLTRANDARAEDLPADARRAPLAQPPARALRIGRPLPARVVHPVTVRLFNALRYRRAPRRETGRIVPAGRYLFPLDRIVDYNLLYGPRGFVEYQFVVPDGSERLLRRSIEVLRAAGCPPLLGVLKRFGGRAARYLSFPIPGWCLGLDVPVGYPGLPGALRRLDDMVAEAGGRIYLAKDARMRPEALEAMYADLAAWRELRARADPKAVFQSDLGRRLDLV